MVKACVFDVDNTLYDTRTLAVNARRNALKAMIEAGLDVELDEAFTRLMGLVKEHGSNYDHHFDRLLEGYGRDGDHHLVAAGVVAYHETKKAFLVPYPDTVPTLLELKANGILLGVASNGKPVKQWEKLIRLGLQHFFDAVVVASGPYGKPDPKPLLDVAARLGVEPGDCLMVGDRVDADVKAAEAAGFKSVLLTPEPGGDYKPKPDYTVKRLSRILDLVG